MFPPLPPTQMFHDSLQSHDCVSSKFWCEGRQPNTIENDRGLTVWQLSLGKHLALRSPLFSPVPGHEQMQSLGPLQLQGKGTLQPSCSFSPYSASCFLAAQPSEAPPLAMTLATFASLTVLLWPQQEVD